ncbi:MAG: exodeoxyribonuclease V subunit alpha [bacterium]
MSGTAMTANDLLSLPGAHLGRMIARAHGEKDDSPLSYWAALLCANLQEGRVFVDIGKPFEGLEAEPVTMPVLSSGSAWLETVEQGKAASGTRPLVLSGRCLWLARYYDFDFRLKQMIDARRQKPPGKIDAKVLGEDIRQLFPQGGASAEVRGQLMAAATLVDRSFGLLTGGPGTGKTTSLARLLVLYLRQGNPAGMQSIRLLAPTGKAAARLNASLKNAVGRLRGDLRGSELGDLLDYLDPDSEKCLVETGTIHSALSVRASRREGQGPFWHDVDNKLKASVVIVDEVSMVDLALMARLCESIPDEAPFILVGDAEQLESIEAGSVLPEIVKNLATVQPERLQLIRDRTGIDTIGANDENLKGADHVRLTYNHRFATGSLIGKLASAVNGGRDDQFINLISGNDAEAQGVTWLRLPAAGRDQPGEIWQAMLGDSGYGPLRRLLDRERDIDAAGAVAAFDQFRVLCAIRKGPDGVERWNERLQKAVVGDLRDGIPRAVMITVNDGASGLCNGDTGLVLPSADGSRLLHSSDGATRPASLLPSSEPGWAITIHKSQGSEYRAVAIIVPRQGGGRLLTRKLLYTALTRARERVIIVATEAALREAVRS